MRRIVWIAIGVVVLAAVGLGALHYLRQGQVDSQLAAVKARLAERGWTLTWSGQEVDGTPFLSDRLRLLETSLVSDRGMLFRIGDVAIAEDEAVPGALAATLPAETIVEVPMGAFAREQMPILPERLKIAVSSDGLRLVLHDTGDAEPMILLAAGSLRAAVDQDDFPIKLAVDATALEGASEPAVDARKLRLLASDFAIDLRDTSGPGPGVIDSRYRDLQIGMTVGATGVDDFAEKFSQLAEKLVSGAFQSTGQTIVVSSVDGADGRPQTLTWKAGPQTGIFEIDGGILTYDSEDRDIEIAVELPGMAAAFDARALFYQRRIKLPLVGGEATPREGALRIAVEDFMPGEGLWKSFDPGERFDRDPADFLLDTTATMRLASGQGRAIPAEFSNVSLTPAGDCRAWRDGRGVGRCRDPAADRPAAGPDRRHPDRGRRAGREAAGDRPPVRRHGRPVPGDAAGLCPPGRGR